MAMREVTLIAKYRCGSDVDEWEAGQHWDSPLVTLADMMRELDRNFDEYLARNECQQQGPRTYFIAYPDSFSDHEGVTI